MRRCRFLGVVFVLCFPLAALADGWPVPRGPSREPIPFRYDSGLWQKVPRPFLEDAAACILYSAMTHLVEADGTVETITHEITRLNSRKGIEGLGEYRAIYFDPQYQKLTLNEARVIKPTGQVVPIEAKHVQLRDISTDYQVYDQNKQLVISFPNLRVGDVYEVKWTVRGKNPEFGEQFFTRYQFGDENYPIVGDELRVRLPKDKPLRWAVSNGRLDPVVGDQGPQRLYHWKAANLPELPRDDDKPSKEELRLQVMCSTFGSWEEVGRWKDNLRADCWSCTAEIRKIVQEVTRDRKTALDKAKALTHWVRHNIRYVSRGPAGAGYTPHLPHQVLANLYGDCKDQAQLLAVMLRQAGLDPQLVTIGALDDGQVVPEVPSPWGSHAILVVPIDGREHWIDTTATHAPWDFLPRADRERQAYVTKGSKLSLRRTPPLTWADVRVEQTTHLTVLLDGTAHCRRQTTYHGSAAVARRDAWNEAPAGERRRLLTAELQDAHSRARLLALRVDESSLQDADRPVVAEAEFLLPRHFAGADKREGSLSDSLVWNRLLAYTVDPDRQVALQLPTPFESKHRFVVELPFAFRFEDWPHDQHIHSRWGWFRLTVQPPAEEGPGLRRLEVTMHTRLEQVRVEPADFLAFGKFQEEVNKHYRAWMTMTPTTDLADAGPLAVLLALAPRPEAVAQLARLLEQHQQLAEARQVLRLGRFLFPDNAGLWELTAKVADGTAAEEQIFRAMVRRFPDEPKYALMLGAALVKLGDQAGARKVLQPLTGHGQAEVRGDAHFSLARSALAQKKPRSALKHLEAAAGADPDSVAGTEAWLFKAQVYEELGQRPEAVAAYQEALQAEPGAPETPAIVAALVRLHLAAGQTQEGLSYLRRFTILAGPNQEHLLQAADFHLQLGRCDDALDLARRATDQSLHARCQRILGLAHLQRQEYAAAVKHLEQAQPDAAVAAGLVRACLALGQLVQAEKVYLSRPEKPLEKVLVPLFQRRDAVQKGLPKSAKRQAAAGAAVEAFVCAEHAFGAGQPSAVVAKLLAAAFPKDVAVGPALALRGLLALQSGRLGKALADADQAIALSPQEGRGFYVRGRVRLERGGQGALADLERAAALTCRHDADVLHWLAAALSQAGRLAEALATQRAALQLRPHDAELAEQLRELDGSA